MKKIENNFAVTGFVTGNAEIRQLTTTSVARFSLAANRQEKNGEETNRVSAFLPIEAWHKNDRTDPFTGKHLHITAKYKGKAFNPMPILEWCLTNKAVIES